MRKLRNSNLAQLHNKCGIALGLLRLYIVASFLKW